MSGTAGPQGQQRKEHGGVQWACADSGTVSNQTESLALVRKCSGIQCGMWKVVRMVELL